MFVLEVIKFTEVKFTTGNNLKRHRNDNGEQ